MCFGELLLRISPASHENAAEKQPMLLYMGGAEANVATALAGWNVPVKYCTVLPDNFMSRHVIAYLEYKGIYTSFILFAHAIVDRLTNNKNYILTFITIFFISSSPIIGA